MIYRTDDTSQMPRIAPTSPRAELWSPAPPRRTGRARRRALVTGAVLVAIAAGATLGVALSRVSGGSAVTTTTTTLPTTPASPSAGASHGVRGHITAETGTSWTVVTARQKTVTVVISPTTKFGTAAAPAAAAQFPVGSAIAVRGRLEGGTITAIRVLVPHAAGSAVTPTTAAG